MLHYNINFHRPCIGENIFICFIPDGKNILILSSTFSFRYQYHYARRAHGRALGTSKHIKEKNETDLPKVPSISNRFTTHHSTALPSHHLLPPAPAQPLPPPAARRLRAPSRRQCASRSAARGAFTLSPSPFSSPARPSLRASAGDECPPGTPRSSLPLALLGKERPKPYSNKLPVFGSDLTNEYTHG